MSQALAVEASELPLSRHVLAGVDGLAVAFATAAPFGHVVIDDFLEPAFARRLLGEFPAFEQGQSRGEDGRAGDKSTVERIRALGPAHARLDEAVKSRDFLSLVGRITGIDGLRYDPWYFGGGTHANRHGAKLDRHVDFSFHPIERWKRGLNLIVYLNEDWDDAWGGALDLYRDAHADEAPARSVSPAFNRCVIFETHDRSWHGFSRIRLPETRRDVVRRSIALYFYTDDAAAGHGGMPRAHSTVYVGDRLPAHLREGHELTAHDVETLQALLADRDGRIRMQYDEIARLMTLLRAHERGPAGLALHVLRKLAARLRR